MRTDKEGGQTIFIYLFRGRRSGLGIAHITPVLIFLVKPRKMFPPPLWVLNLRTSTRVNFLNHLWKVMFKLHFLSTFV
jgi:hypothetical protein